MKSTDIAPLLPAVFRRTILSGDSQNPLLPNPASALLDCMEGLHEPTEAILENFAGYFDPRRAPEPFVYYLAAWLDLRRFLSSGNLDRGAVTGPLSPSVGQLREWIANAAQLSRWSGTRKGLVESLELATGVTGFQILENEAVRPFHLRVVAPPEALPQRALIERIIELEKPAYMTYDAVEFAVSNLESQDKHNADV